MNTREHRFLGLDVTLTAPPGLDPGFLPMSAFWEAHEKRAAQGREAGIAIEGPAGVNRVLFRLMDAENPAEADKYAALQLAKSLMWIYGGYRLTVAGSDTLAEYLRRQLSSGGLAFDNTFMSGVYERPIELCSAPMAELPEATKPPAAVKASEGFTGCRIGFDAGGSDIKVSAVIDGKAVFSKEILWHPKTNPDPSYHYAHIVEALRLGASKLPRVDGIGVSSAGIYVNNRTMVASLFMQVPRDKFEKYVKDIYIRAAGEIGDVPLVVANDGDVTALAGAMEYGGGLLGIAMGTSQAGGYVDGDGCIAGWLNELAFTPVDANPAAMLDEWSGDRGRGVKYFSQDAVIKLAEPAGIALPEGASPAEKLLTVQELMKAGDDRAARVYASLGAYLGHTLPYYSRFYALKRVLFMGRVMSGEGGALILEKARETLREAYPALHDAVTLLLPDENNRRVGQSVAAASLL